MVDARPVLAEADVRRCQPYPEYKPTGLPGVPAIPAHWEMKRLKTFAEVQLSNVDKKSVEGEDDVQLCNYTDVYYNERITASLEFMPATATRDQIARFSLCKGDVLITKDSESWSDIGVPTVVAETLEGVICGYHLAHIRPVASVEGRFLARAFGATGVRDQFHVAANGITRYGLSTDDIAAARFPIPPLAEQLAIADFLDRETAKIDVLMVEKQRVIGLLREKRAALITRAVTKGLDSAAPMKDSGMDWLGEIPQHWALKRLKHLVVEPLKYGAGEAAELTDPELPRYIRITDINDDGSLRHETFRSLPEDVAAPYLLSQGDLLFARSGATVGKTFRYEPSRGRAAHAGYLIRARLDNRVSDPRFVTCFTQSGAYWDWLHGNFVQATIQNVNAERYSSLVVPVPPVLEQEAIIEQLETELNRLEELVARVRAAIDHLEEFRLALISAAVTGKIDVRGEAA